MLKYILIFLLLPSIYSSYGFEKHWSLISTEDEISIYSLKDSSSDNGVIPFKASGEINASIGDVLKLLKNHELKPTWSPKLKSVVIHKKINDQEFIFSEYYKTPWPAFDREFLMHGKITFVNESKITLNAKSLSQHDKNFKKYLNSNHIQAQVTYINLTLNKTNSNTTYLEFEFHGDMKGWMPVWLMNLIQKKWPLRFIKGMRNQLELKNINTIARN